MLREFRDVTATWVAPARHHSDIRKGLDAGIATRVVLRDWLCQSELRGVYDSHGIFVFPSFFGGAGKAALEAMSRGLCVVASHTGRMCDTIRDGENGPLCPVGNVRVFCHRIGALLADYTQARPVSRAPSAAAAGYS